MRLFFPWRRKFREGIGEASDFCWDDIFDHIHQRMPIKHQMHGPTHAWIRERFLGIIHPDGMNHALIEIGKLHIGHGFDFARRHGIDGTGIIDLAAQQ